VLEWIWEIRERRERVSILKSLLFLVEGDAKVSYFEFGVGF